jgi:hypothetical protein
VVKLKLPESMTLATGCDELAQELLDALGLTGLSNVASFTLDVQAAEPITATLVLRITTEQLRNLVDCVKSRDLALVGTGGVAIKAGILDKGRKPDPEKDMRELIELLNKETAYGKQTH